MRAALLVLAAAKGFAQLAYFQFDPPVIVPGTTQSIVLSVRPTVPVTSIVFQWTIVQSPDLPFKDNGSGLYSVTLPAATIVNATTPAMTFRPAIGFVNPMNASGSLGRYGVNAEIAAPEIARLPITQDAPDVQHTAYLVNIRMPSAFPAGSSTTLPDSAPIARRFYQLFPDQFDMLNIVYSPAYYLNRFHFATRNDVQGTGVQIFNNDSNYGSAGALIGINIFPLTDYFDGAETAFIHEFGHQFINFQQVAPLKQGSPHWPVSDLAAGVMGFSLPDGAGGLFPCQVTQEGNSLRLISAGDPPVYNDLELYLLGLIPPEQVGTHFVFADQSNGGVISKCTVSGSLYTGAFTTVTMADILGTAGKRSPDSTASKKNYRLATILVTRDALLDADTMALYSYFARRAEETGRIPSMSGLAPSLAKPMSVATGGRLTLNMQVTPASFPSIFFGGVANGSSGAAGTYAQDLSSAVSPGSFVSIYGSGLAAAPAQAPTAVLPTSLGGVAVLVNGKAAPLFYVSSGQVNFQLPFETALGAASVVVQSQGQSTSIAWIRVAAAAPGITVFGANRAAIRNQDTAVNLPGNPAAVGSVISIYMTGIGPVSPPVASGQPAPESPLAIATRTVTVTIGGKSAHVEFAGLTPDATALAQVNVTVPQLAPGDYPVIVSVAGVPSNAPLVSIR